MPDRTLVEVGGGVVEVLAEGEGPTVILVPSLGRSAEDLADLAGRLAERGYRALRPEPRGIGGSTAPLDGLTMATLADDIAAVVGALAPTGSTATVVGHAFGNRVVRMVATCHPDVVDGVVLLAAGGLVAPDPAVAAALSAVFDESLSAEDHLEAVRSAFFAPGGDASVWAGGWYPAVAAAQGRANRATDRATWWTAGSAPVLVVQPADDIVAVPANAERLAAEIGDRATVVTVERAGHALLPERLEAVADAVLTWLDAHHDHKETM